MLEITSAQNPRVAALRALRQAKGRAETGLFLAEGRKLCREAFEWAQVETLLVEKERLDEFSALTARARDVLVVPVRIMETVCETKTPQGVAAAVRIPAPLDAARAEGLVLALDGVQDPGNVGTMLRTAEAAGFSGALLSPACADAFAPKTVRATMGSVYRMPVWRGELAGALSALKERGFSVVSTELGGEDFFAALPGLKAPLALVIGSEGNGVTPAVRALSTHRLALPMAGHVESMNAAVAAGILMYSIGHR